MIDNKLSLRKLFYGNSWVVKHNYMLSFAYLIYIIKLKTRNH